MLSVTIGTLIVNDMPSSKDELVAIPITNTTTNSVSYTVTSSNSSVTGTIVTAGESLKLNVSGTDSTNTAFTGDLTIQLFSAANPITTTRIKELVNSNFYNGKTFHRIIQDFVVQGGDPAGNGSGGTGTKFSDEYSTNLTFTSSGLLAMANSGDDTNDSQFFITDVDLPLASLPQHLNFQHTIFGILTSGFDTYRKLMSTPTNGNGTPNTTQTINTATIINDNQNGVLRLSSAAGFTGSSTITVTANDGQGSTNQKQFTLNVVSDAATNDRAFLGTVTNKTTNQGTPITFNVTGTDLELDNLTFVVKDAASWVGDTSTGSAPANIGVAITVTPASGSTPATAAITLTPQNNFTGTVNLLVGVRDQVNRQATNPSTPGAVLDSRGNFDTQAITLRVNAVPTIANPIADQTFTGSGNKTFAFAANTFADADSGDTLTYTATQVGGSALPAWLSFSSATRTFSGNPSGSDVTPLQIRVTANDGNGGTITDDFQLTLTNVSDPTAVANAIPDQTFTGSGNKSFAFAENTFTGDGLTYAATLVGGGALPSWLTFTPGTRTFSGNPGASNTTPLQIRVTATDAINATASDDFQLTLTNVNDTPVLAPIGDKFVVAGTPISFTISGTDADSPPDTLSFFADTMPTGATFDANTRTFTWTPSTTTQGSGSFLATFRVDDNSGTLDSLDSEQIDIVVVTPASVFRLYAETTGDHFYTTSSAGREHALANGYTDESSAAGAYKVSPTEVSESSVLFRLLNPITNVNGGGHYYTMNSAEKDILVGLGWVQESNEGFMFQTQVTTTVEVFRLYNTVTGKHLFTSSTAERDATEALADWVLHSKLGFAFTPGTSSSSSPAVAAPAIATAELPEGFFIPSSISEIVDATVTLQPTESGASSLQGEFGMFVVATDSGMVNGLLPGSAGYAAAALGSAKRQAIFGAGDTLGTERSVALAGSSYIGWYYVPGGTAAGVLASNPSNSTSGPYALFSFDAANADGAEHIRLSGASSGDVYTLHLMDELFSNQAMFDDFMMTIDLDR